MKFRISEFGWKAGFRLCRKRPDLWKITSKRGQSGAKTKFLGSVLPSGSDLWKHYLLACLLLTVLAVNLVSCGEKEEKKISPLGITEEEYAETAYDLDQIQEAGELIAVTLSGPDTYYEYKGKGFGLQFELAEHFAVSIGAKLRMEAVRDTAELFQRLKKGEADLIALEIPENHVTDTELQFSGVRSCPSDSTAAVKTGWVVRKDVPFLAEALDGWYSPETRSFLQKREQLRLSPGGSVKRRVRAPFQNRAKGIISPYDTHFIRHSQAIGWDWRLMAAQCYQESGFDPEAVSWAGARGLMQIMPETAVHLGLPADQMHQPEKNISAAARYLRELERKFSDIPGRSERINFILAAYNGGTGHVRDAMALARKHGKNPQLWNDVAPFILRLSQPQYYNDPVVRYGYLRGEETYGYVTSIRERWQRYRAAVHGGTTGGVAPAPSRKNSHGGFKSKVLSAEELEAKSKQNTP